MQLEDAKGLVTVLVGVGVTGAVGLLVLSTISTNGAFTGAAAGVIANITLAISGFFGLMPTVGIVFAAVIVLAAVAYIGYQGYQKLQ